MSKINYNRILNELYSLGREYPGMEDKLRDWVRKYLVLYQEDMVTRQSTLGYMTNPEGFVAQVHRDRIYKLIYKLTNKLVEEGVVSIHDAVTEEDKKFGIGMRTRYQIVVVKEHL